LGRLKMDRPFLPGYSTKVDTDIEPLSEENETKHRQEKPEERKSVLEG